MGNNTQIPSRYHANFFFVLRTKRRNSASSLKQLGNNTQILSRYHANFFLVLRTKRRNSASSLKQLGNNTQIPSRYHANSFLVLRTKRRSNKYQLVWPDRCSNPRSTTLEENMLTNTPPMWLRRSISHQLKVISNLINSKCLQFPWL